MEPPPLATEARPPRFTAIFIVGAVLVIGFIGGALVTFRYILPGMEDRTIAISHMRELTRATAIYGYDSDGLTPPCSTWMDALTPYTSLDSQAFHSPKLSSGGAANTPFGVSMNINDGSVPYLQPVDTRAEPLYFEGKATGPNASAAFPAGAESRYGSKDSQVIPVAGFNLSYGLYQVKTGQIKWLQGQGSTLL